MSSGGTPGFPGPLVIGTDDDDLIVRKQGGVTTALDGDDTVRGSEARDQVLGGDGDDLIRGGSDDDRLQGGRGDDDLRGGQDDDILIGGRGDDHLTGGKDADRFLFNPRNPNEGHDRITDLDIAGGDRLVLNAADILGSTPGLTSADPFGDRRALEATDLDQDPLWDIVESSGGFVEVLHPTGSITIEGLAFDPNLTFADLLPAIVIDNIQLGDNSDNDLDGGNPDDFLAGAFGDDDLFGRDGDDVLLGDRGDDVLRGGDHDDILDSGNGDDRINGGDGEDLIVGGRGDDNLRGGADEDTFVFDPSRILEGEDIIRDFTVGEDKLALSAADIATATPEILQAIVNGDTSDIASAGALLTALDDSPEWDISGAPGSNNLLVMHPGGTIEFGGIAFAGQTFVGLAGIFDVDALNLQIGDGNGNDLEGTRGADILNGKGRIDHLAGGSDDDLLIGGNGGDFFAFTPTNGNEGSDIIADFNPGEGDKIQLAAADVVASLESNLLNDGFQFTDLDDSARWDFNAKAGGDAVITHAGGEIALAGLGSALQGVTSFVDFTDDPSGLGLDVLSIV